MLSAGTNHHRDYSLRLARGGRLDDVKSGITMLSAGTNHHRGYSLRLAGG